MDLNPFSTVHHIAIVVRDIDASIEYYESIGIGPWEDMDLSAYSRVDAKHEEAFRDLRFKRAHLGPIQWQLVQPGDGDGPEKRFLDEHGEGVFHVGFHVDDIGAADHVFDDLALPILARGRRDDGTGFTYLDVADRAGVTLVARQSPAAELKR